MRRTSAWYLPILVCFSLMLTACGDAILPAEPDLDGPRKTVHLKPVVVEAGCSDPTWRRDPSGQCWPPDPVGGGSGGDDSGGDRGGGDPVGGGGGGGAENSDEPDDPEDPDPCDTGDAHLDAPNVYGGFEQLWAQSIENGVEQGGWIVQDGDSFRLVPFRNADYSPCGIDINESPPAGTVAMVHTHPWPLFTVDPCGNVNTGTPSDEDVAALQALGLSTGYLLDANGIGKYNATSGESARRIGRCGY